MGKDDDFSMIFQQKKMERPHLLQENPEKQEEALTDQEEEMFLGDGEGKNGAPWT